jgi:flavin-binding protein dodecin
VSLRLLEEDARGSADTPFRARVHRDHPRTRRKSVTNHVYRLSEIVGSSPTSIDDAIRTGLAKAAETVRNIEWFQTEEIRGQVVDGEVAHYQVTMKVGFRVD